MSDAHSLTWASDVTSFGLLKWLETVLLKSISNKTDYLNLRYTQKAQEVFINK